MCRISIRDQRIEQLEKLGRNDKIMEIIIQSMQAVYNIRSVRWYYFIIINISG